MSAIRAIAEWRPSTPFYYGWLVLGTAALASYAATGVAQVVLGGIQNLIFEEMGWDRGVIAYAATAGTWASGLLSPFVGRLADRYGPRGLMPIAAIVVGGCFFAIAGIEAVWQFYAAYIIARTIANPNLVGVVPRTAAVNFFRRRRSLAIALVAMARPVGGAINIQVISLIAQASSWRTAYRFLGAFTVLLAIPLLLVMRRRPEDIGLRPDGDGTGRSSRPDGGSRSDRETHPDEFQWRVGEAALTQTFWFIVVAESLIILSTGALGFQSLLYLKDAGLSQVAAAGAVSLSSLLGALTTPAWGYLSDRYSPRRMLLFGLAITVVATSLFLFTHSGGKGFLVVVLWGTASGGLNVLSHMILARYFGRASFGSITGLMAPFQFTSLGLGPTVGALLFSLTGGYIWLFRYAVASFAVAFLFVFRVRPPEVPRRAFIERSASQD